MIPLSLPKNWPANNLSVHSSLLIRLAAAVENAPKKQEVEHRLSLKANGNLQMAIDIDYGNYVTSHVHWDLTSKAEAWRAHTAKAGTNIGIN